MQKILKMLFMASMAIFLVAGTSTAVEITTWDWAGSGSGWYGGQEDNEVEPGCITGSAWDLEGMFLIGNTLSMVGTYNFITGQSGMTSGDIFLDTGDDTLGYIHGYDTVLDVNWGSGTYSAVSLGTGATFQDVSVGINVPESSPWKVNTWGSNYTIEHSGTFNVTSFADGTAYDGVTFDGEGNLHYVADGFDLSFLSDGFLAHFTMECGNDNLIGSVPEPSTMFLSAVGLFGLAIVGRKRVFKK